MEFRLFRRLLAFAITAAVVAAFGYVAAFVAGANRNNLFLFTPQDFSSADIRKIEDFLDSDGPGEIALSENDIYVYLNELYYRDRENSSAAARAVPRLPNFAIEDGFLRIGVPVSMPLLFRPGIPELAFYARPEGGGLSVVYARLGESRIPAFLAGRLFKRILGDYKNVSALNKSAAKLSLLKDMKILDGKLVLTK